jgi:hypothetical protein
MKPYVDSQTCCSDSRRFLTLIHIAAESFMSSANHVVNETAIRRSRLALALQKAGKLLLIAQQAEDQEASASLSDASEKVGVDGSDDQEPLINTLSDAIDNRSASSSDELKAAMDLLGLCNGGDGREDNRSRDDQQSNDNDNLSTLAASGDIGDHSTIADNNDDEADANLNPPPYQSWRTGPSPLPVSPQSSVGLFARTSIPAGEVTYSEKPLLLVEWPPRWRTREGKAFKHFYQLIDTQNAMTDAEKQSHLRMMSSTNCEFVSVRDIKNPYHHLSKALTANSMTSLQLVAPIVEYSISVNRCRRTVVPYVHLINHSCALNALMRWDV